MDRSRVPVRPCWSWSASPWSHILAVASKGHSSSSSRWLIHGVPGSSPASTPSAGSSRNKDPNLNNPMSSCSTSFWFAFQGGVFSGEGSADELPSSSLFGGSLHTNQTGNFSNYSPSTSSFISTELLAFFFDSWRPRPASCSSGSTESKSKEKEPLIWDTETR